MGLFRRRATSPPVEKRSLLPGGLFAPTSLDGWSGQSTAGVTVTSSTSLENVAVWACQRVLVSTISMQPINVIRTQGNKRTFVNPQPKMVANPSGRVSRRGWVAQVLRSALGAGNIYGRVVATDTLNRPLQIETIHPDDVTWLIVGGEEVPYVGGKAQTIWPLGDFWHVPASQFLMPGSRGAMNPTEFAKTSIGTGIAAERFGANFFRDGLHPSAVVTVDADLQMDQAMLIKQSVMNMARGNREPLIVGSDVTKVEPWGANLTDSQFIELLQFEVLQACRVWGVPPSMVYAAMSGQNVTYLNIGQADMQFLKFGCQPWVVDLEDAWSELIAAPHSVKFDFSGLLRMDDQARADLAKTRLANKTATVNEVRDDDDLERFADPIFDTPGIPGGNQSITQMVKEITPGIGVVMTSDEGRAILNENGADLPIPGPTDLGAMQPSLPGIGDPNA